MPSPELSPGTQNPQNPHFPAPLSQACNVPAVLATSGPRGSFLSLIDCTLLRACLKEVLPFPGSFLLLPVFPFAAGAQPGPAELCRHCPHQGGEKQPENIPQPTAVMS